MDEALAEPTGSALENVTQLDRRTVAHFRFMVKISEDAFNRASSGIDPQGTTDYQLPFPGVSRPQDIPAATVFTHPDGSSLPIGSPGAQYVRRPSDETKPSASEGFFVGVPEPDSALIKEDLWHYTDGPGLLGIVQNQCLWASSVRFLNDSSEYLYGFDIFSSLIDLATASRYIHPYQKRYLEWVRDQVRDVESSDLYIASASLAVDSLSQWSIYGGQSPHAVVLRPGEKMTIRGDRDRIPDEVTHAPVWRKVLYQSSDQEKLLSLVVSFLCCLAPQDEEYNCTPRSMMIIDAVREYILGCKDPAYASEQEARIIVRPVAGESVFFRSGAYGVTPYVKLHGNRVGGSLRTTEKSLPLSTEKIVTGPFEHTETSAHGIRALLKANGRDKVPVEATRLRFHR